MSYEQGRAKVEARLRIAIEIYPRCGGKPKVIASIELVARRSIARVAIK